jgi:hypothetical protein
MIGEGLSHGPHATLSCSSQTTAAPGDALALSPIKGAGVSKRVLLGLSPTKPSSSKKVDEVTFIV